MVGAPHRQPTSASAPMKSRVSPTGSYLFRVQKKRDLERRRIWAFSGSENLNTRTGHTRGRTRNGLFWVVTACVLQEVFLVQGVVLLSVIGSVFGKIFTVKVLVLKVIPVGPLSSC